MDEQQRRREESWAPQWRQEIGNLHQAQPDPRRSCSRHPGQPSGAACLLCYPAPPAQQASAGPTAMPVFAARAADGAEPDVVTTATPLPPTRTESCEVHPGSRSDAGGECRGCRADRLAASPSPSPRPDRVPQSRVERALAYLDWESRREAVHGGRACSCEECADRRHRVWAQCGCCGAAMRSVEQQRGHGLCRACADLVADIRAGRPLPVARQAPRSQLEQARAAVRAAKAGVRARAERDRTRTPRSVVPRPSTGGSRGTSSLPEPSGRPDQPTG